jgi:hypothetical protein
VAKSENGVTTTYVVAVLGLSQVLVETTDGETTRYVYGSDGSVLLTTNLPAKGGTI